MINLFRIAFSFLKEYFFPAISLEETRHIADLANLNLTDKELKKHQKELSKVINYSKILEEVDTNGVEETAQTTGLINVFRKDKIKKSLSQKEALSNAKKTYNGYFKVPKILEHA